MANLGYILDEKESGLIDMYRALNNKGKDTILIISMTLCIADGALDEEAITHATNMDEDTAKRLIEIAQRLLECGLIVPP